MGQKQINHSATHNILDIKYKKKLKKIDVYCWFYCVAIAGVWRAINHQTIPKEVVSIFNRVKSAAVWWIQVSKSRTTRSSFIQKNK